MAVSRWQTSAVATYRIRYPEHFDQDAAIIEAKGWFRGIVVEADGVEHRPVFYDPVRLSQDCADSLARDGFFYEQSIVVVPRVTREHIDAAVERLSRVGFSTWAKPWTAS